MKKAASKTQFAVSRWFPSWLNLRPLMMEVTCSSNSLSAEYEYYVTGERALHHNRYLEPQNPTQIQHLTINTILDFLEHYPSSCSFYLTSTFRRLNCFRP
jgi:hypothetical protein